MKMKTTEVFGFRTINIQEDKMVDLKALKVGDEIEIQKKLRVGTSKKKAKIYKVNGNHVTIDYGNYKGTINIHDIITGRTKIIKDGEVMKTAKITKKQLYEECKEYGTDDKACQLIADKYGLKPITIEKYIKDQKIKQRLKGETNTEEKTTENKADMTEEEISELISSLPFNIENSMKLKPVSYQSQRNKNIKYNIEGDKLFIETKNGNGAMLDIPTLPEIISDLKELAELEGL